MSTSVPVDLLLGLSRGLVGYGTIPYRFVGFGRALGRDPGFPHSESPQIHFKAQGALGKRVDSTCNVYIPSPQNLKP